MRLAIPLPWYSKQVYDIVNDEVRGGWRLLILHADIRKSGFYGPRCGFNLHVVAGLGTRFQGKPIWFAR